MRRRQLVQIEDLAIGRRLAVERRAIPRGKPGLVIAVIDLRRVPLAVDLIGRADLVGRLAAMIAGAVMLAGLRPGRRAAGEDKAERNQKREFPRPAVLAPRSPLDAHGSVPVSSLSRPRRRSFQPTRRSSPISAASSSR